MIISRLILQCDFTPFASHASSMNARLNALGSVRTAPGGVKIREGRFMDA